MCVALFSCACFMVVVYLFCEQHCVNVCLIVVFFVRFSHFMLYGMHALPLWFDVAAYCLHVRFGGWRSGCSASAFMFASSSWPSLRISSFFIRLVSVHGY